MLGSMGADFIDYLITDRIVTPPHFALDFSENFAIMPDSYFIASRNPLRQAKYHQWHMGSPRRTWSIAASQH